MGYCCRFFYHTIVNWNEVADPTNSFDPSTGIYTIPRTGWYLVSAGVNLNGGQTYENVVTQIQITQNGTVTVLARETRHHIGVEPIGGFPDSPFCSLSQVLYLTAGNNIRLFGGQNNSGGSTHNVTNDPGTYFSATFLKSF
jgi:hypothetical protein